MSDQELADAIVALGVATIDTPPHERSGWRVDNRWITNDPAIFVRDWRVTGALMEKMSLAELSDLFDLLRFAVLAGENESLPRAINEACVEALT